MQGQSRYFFNESLNDRRGCLSDGLVGVRDVAIPVFREPFVRRSVSPRSPMIVANGVDGLHEIIEDRPDISPTKSD
jgi:hypothetical protein